MSNVDSSNAPKLPKTNPCPKSKIKHVIAVLSGKGGVGKSFTSSYLAVLLRRRGYKVGILDADITGPSIPYAFNVQGPINGDGVYFYPVTSKTGIQIMSSNLLLNNPEDPLVWRGPMLSTLCEQFYTECVWDVDYLIIDMAPGTSDISLTVFQKIKLSEAIIVTSPQGLVSQVVEKSARMADLLSVPVISMVENMAYVKCDHCGHEIKLYGPSHPELAAKHGIPVFDQIPFDAKIAEHMDKGDIESLDVDYLKLTVDKIIATDSKIENE